MADAVASDHAGSAEFSKQVFTRYHALCISFSCWLRKQNREVDSLLT